MAERINLNGVNGTAGRCLSCGLILIVTDKNETGAFTTYHEEPMCDWYLNRCKSAEDIGPLVVTAGSAEG